MLPPPCSSISTPISRHSKKGPSRFTSSTRRQSAAEVRSAGAICAIPALFTRTSACPNCSRTVAAIRCAVSSRDMSPMISIAARPFAAHDCTIVQDQRIAARRKHFRRTQADPLRRSSNDCDLRHGGIVPSQESGQTPAGTIHLSGACKIEVPHIFPDDKLHPRGTSLTERLKPRIGIEQRYAQQGHTDRHGRFPRAPSSAKSNGRCSGADFGLPVSMSAAYRTP